MERRSNLHVIVVFKGVESSDAIKEYAISRANKLTKHLHEMINCHFTFSKGKNGSLVQVHVNAGDFDAKSEAVGENLFAAVDEATDKALQQSRKHKEKVTDHKKWEARTIQPEISDQEE